MSGAEAWFLTKRNSASSNSCRSLKGDQSVDRDEEYGGGRESGGIDVPRESQGTPRKFVSCAIKGKENIKTYH